MTPVPSPIMLPKALTGISGFDEITQGGLPAGRPTLVCGGAGCGKTLFAATFLLNGATLFDETGVFMSFEERADDIAANVRSLGYDLHALVAEGRIVVDHVQTEHAQFEENGEFDLDGLFLRIGFAVNTVGAKRIVLDTIETLFGHFTNPAFLRTEFCRLFGWIKDRGLTAVITGERGAGELLTRQGLEEYVSDCVILFENRVQNQRATRLLRVMKYRGSPHGTDEYPFLIDQEGIKVLPTSALLVHRPASNDIIPLGIPDIDAMFGKRGLYRGSSILLSGVSGAGKTTIGTLFLDAACARGERCMFFGLEESEDENCRNALSIGVDLKHWVSAGLLTLEGSRQIFGLETHLARIYRDLDSFRPDAVVIDPISAFRGPESYVYMALLRIVNLLKARGISALFTSLLGEASFACGGEHIMLPMMDTCISLMSIESHGSRTNALHVIKSRGMSHSNKIRPYRISSNGFEMLGPATGSDDIDFSSSRQVPLAGKGRAESLAVMKGTRP